MPPPFPEDPIVIDLGDRLGPVPGLLLAPPEPRAILAFAHGAGAGMRHRFMEAMAAALAGRGIATLRYQFPYMEAGGRRPDPPGVLEHAVRRAVAAAAAAAPGLPLYAGGKSLGGRMTSNAAARTPLDGVRGIVFFGFPLHAPKAEGVARAGHLARVRVPMLFLQGTRDTLARLDLLTGVVRGLGPPATLHVVDGADHGFAVLKRSGRTDLDVLAELADAVEQWIRAPDSGSGAGPRAT